MLKFFKKQKLRRVSHSRKGNMGDPMIFLKPPIETDGPHGCPAFKNVVVNWKPTLPPLKNKASFQEMIPGKNHEKLETNNCVLIIKQQWKKIAETPQERDFLTWTIQYVVRIAKQFVRNYYITWLVDLANKLYDVEKSWFHFMLCVMKKIVLFY